MHLVITEVMTSHPYYQNCFLAPTDMPSLNVGIAWNLIQTEKKQGKSSIQMMVEWSDRKSKLTRLQELQDEFRSKAKS